MAASIVWRRNRDMSPTPLVSIVVATYNRAHVVAHAIASVRRSTVTDWELIVVGDRCTDDTEAVVAGFADPRITWVNLPENAGEQSGPNNEGIRRARGRYLALLNHDDLFFPRPPGDLDRLLRGDRRRSGLVAAAGRAAGLRGRRGGGPGAVSPQRRHVRRRLRPARVRVRIVVADVTGTDRPRRTLAVRPRHLRHRVAGLDLPRLAQRRAPAVPCPRGCPGGARQRQGRQLCRRAQPRARSLCRSHERAGVR